MTFRRLKSVVAPWRQRDTDSTIPAISQYQSKLGHSISQYQQTAKDLEAELVSAFHTLSKKTGMKLWEPLKSLQNKDDIPKLNDIINDAHENIEKLRNFNYEGKSKPQWEKVKRGINKFVNYTLPALSNFLIATKDTQSVSGQRFCALTSQ